MADQMLMCLKILQNNNIRCNNNRDIMCLQFLANAHPHPDVRQLAIMNLVRCGAWGSIGGKKRKKRKKRRTSKKKTKKRRKSRRRKRRKTGAARTKHNAKLAYNTQKMEVIPNPHFKKPSPIELKVQGQKVTFHNRDVKQQRKMLTQYRKLSKKGGRRKKRTKRRR